MSTLPTYTNFEGKSENFKLTFINTLSDFDDLKSEFGMMKGIYRGISSASYKIYTSLQRQIITKSLGGKFSLDKYVSIVRRDNLMKKYFKAFNIVPSKLSIYSYLQHYGAPTPFLDFTSNFEKALYFATEGFDDRKVFKDHSIDDYISIFFISEDDLEILKILYLFDGLKQQKRLSESILSQYEDYTNEALVRHIDNLFDNNTLEVFLIDYREEFIEVYNTYNNIRIIAQEGLFIHNSYENIPLEEALKSFLKESTVYTPSLIDYEDYSGWQEAREEDYLKRLEVNREYQNRLENNIIQSFEIHKSIVPDIIRGISLKKGDIYPDAEKMTWSFFENTIKA